MNVVRFHVDDDEAAKRVAAVLHALGYDPIREASDPEAAADEAQVMLNAIDRIARQYKFTERETEVFDLVVAQGVHPRDAAERLDRSDATVKWHMHNIFTKTTATDREALLRLLLKTQAEVSPR